jgi:hypothetical protein
MQSIGVLKNGGRRPPMATFSNKGRRKEVPSTVIASEAKQSILLAALWIASSGL